MEETTDLLLDEGSSIIEQKKKKARETKTILQWIRRNIENTPEQKEEKRKRATELQRKKRQERTDEEKEENRIKRRKTSAEIETAKDLKKIQNRLDRSKKRALHKLKKLSDRFYKIVENEYRDRNTDNDYYIKKYRHQFYNKVETGIERRVRTKEIRDAWVKYNHLIYVEGRRIGDSNYHIPPKETYYMGDEYGNLCQDQQLFDALKKRKELQNHHFASLPYEERALHYSNTAGCSLPPKADNPRPLVRWMDLDISELSSTDLQLYKFLLSDFNFL